MSKLVLPRMKRRRPSNLFRDSFSPVSSNLPLILNASAPQVSAPHVSFPHVSSPPGSSPQVSTPRRSASHVSSPRVSTPRHSASRNGKRRYSTKLRTLIEPIHLNPITGKNLSSSNTTKKAPLPKIPSGKKGGLFKGKSAKRRRH